MLNVDFFTFNAFEENTYVISNDKKQCWIVDPGMYGPQEAAQMIASVRTNFNMTSSRNGRFPAQVFSQPTLFGEAYMVFISQSPTSWRLST